MTPFATMTPSPFRSVLQYESADELVRALNLVSLRESGPQSEEKEDPTAAPVYTDWQLSNYDINSSIKQATEQEARRLLTLKSYHVLETEREAEFDCIASQIRERIGAQLTVMAFVDLGRVWVKASASEKCENREVSRQDSFCAHTILSKDGGVCVVGDLSKDERFHKNPYVVGASGFRFHVGVPLVTPDGYCIGSICILDDKPRVESLSARDETFLLSKAAETMKLLVKRKSILETELKRSRYDITCYDSSKSSPLSVKKLHVRRSGSDEIIVDDISILNSPPSRPVDPNSSAADPDQYLAELLKTIYGIQPKITPALQLQKYFPKITEEQMAAYTMEVVSATRKNNVERLRDLFLTKGRSCLDCYNRFGEGLLNIACRRGFKDIVKFLLSSNVKLSVRVHDDYGRTPLHDACWHPEPQLDICAWILEEDPSLFLIADKRGYTPFQYSRKSDWGIWRQFLFDNIDRFEALTKPNVFEQFR